MSFERLVALEIHNHEAYQAYRDGMTPMLHAVGGDFIYDFEIAKTLKAPDLANYNRIFTIRFPDQATHDAFFADPAYLAIRDEFFDSAVSNTAKIAAYPVL